MARQAGSSPQPCLGLKWIVAVTIISLAVVRAGAMQATSRPGVDYQKIADGARWIHELAIDNDTAGDAGSDAQVN